MTHGSIISGSFKKGEIIKEKRYIAVTQFKKRKTQSELIDAIRSQADDFPGWG